MSAGQVAAFLGVSLLVIVTPGQDTALTIRNTLAGGRRGGVFTALGVVSGQVTWAVASERGARRPARRLAAGVHRAATGRRGLPRLPRRAGAHGSRSLPERGAAGRRKRRTGPRLAYRQGLVSNLGNAKIAVFFTSLLPQFGTTFWTMLPLGLCFAALTLVWLSAYAVAVSKAAHALRRPRIRRLLDAAAGTVLVALGVRLAAER